MTQHYVLENFHAPFKSLPPQSRALIMTSPLRRNTKVSQVNKPPEQNATISVQPKSSESSVKLPKITIKTFDGKPVYWTTFWGSYNVTVHLNEGLSKVQKFTYLLSLLQGTASDTVSGFTLTDSSYNAVDLLHERHSNKQLIINSHIEQLVQLPEITHEEHTKKLRNLLTDVRSLNSLGISTSSFGNFLVPLILNKLPQKLRVDIGGKFKSPSELWQLDGLLKAFKEELTAKETARFEPESFKSGDKKRFEPFRNQSKSFASQALYTGRPAESRMANAENQNPGRNTPNCTYCSQGHPSLQCHIVTEVQAGKSILRSKGRCFLCLRGNHVICNCQSSKPNCHMCGMRHHPSICEGKKSQLSTPQTRLEGDVAVTPKVSGVTSNNYCYADRETNVLLQTAPATVTNVEQSKSIQTRVLFDLGSQKSYCTLSVKNTLNLPTLKKEWIMIKTLGEANPRVRECDSAQLRIQGFEGTSLYLNVFAVDRICFPLSNQTIELTQDSYPHLRGLQLADNTQEETDLEVHILIEADYYWNFFSDETVRRGTGTPVATNSKLGWLLSGPSAMGGGHQQPVHLIAKHVMKVECSEIDSLTEQVSRFWDLDSIGIKENEPFVY